MVLIVPTTNQIKTNKLNKEIVKYSDQISGKMRKSAR